MATEIKETHNLIGSDKVDGTAVYGADGEKIGSIERMMIDKLSGKVSFAVLSFGFTGVYSHDLRWVFTLKITAYLFIVPLLVARDPGLRLERLTDARELLLFHPYRRPAGAGDHDQAEAALARLPHRLRVD